MDKMQQLWYPGVAVTKAETLKGTAFDPNQFSEIDAK